VADRKEGQIRFVELKAGRKNAEITNAAQFSVTSGCEQFESFTTSEFDETDVRHYKRVKRQIIRNRTILDTIRNEGGTDHNTGAKVQISVTDGPPELWSDTIMRCYSQLSDAKTWAIAAIDDCVYVGVYSNQDAAFVGFKAWMRQMKCESPIYNLTDSFRIPSARPLGATFLSPDLQKKVLRGEILVIICLDILNLIKMANEMRAEFLSLVPKSKPAMYALRYHMLELNGQLVRAAIGSVSTFIGAGFRDRVVFDQQRPSQLIHHQIDQLIIDTQVSTAES
jgi:hypothetical protein